MMASLTTILSSGNMRNTTANATTCLPIRGRESTAASRIAAWVADTVGQTCSPFLCWTENAGDVSRKGAKAQRQDKMFTQFNETIAEKSRDAGVLFSSSLCAFAPLREKTASTTTCLTIRVHPCSSVVSSECSSMRRVNPAASRHPSLATKLTTDHWPLATGFTLIEMLVVVTIMMIMVAAAATMMQPASDSRRLRETARAVNVYLSSARNRAMETGRPCGVIFRAFRNAAGNPTLPCAMTADQCEVPPSYSGDTADAAVTIVGGVSGNTVTATATITPANSFLYTLVSLNDLIQFGCQGPLYKITSANSTTIVATLDVSSGQSTPWTGNASPPVPYRIFRAPKKGMATPLQLPTSAVVDLAWSGDSTSYAGANDCTILFSPNGSVYVGTMNNPIAEPVYLLIGKRERVPLSTYNPADTSTWGNTYNSSNPATWMNWQDPACFWVVVNPQTGLVTTGQVTATTVNDKSGVVLSRNLAAQAQSIGGK